MYLELTSNDQSIVNIKEAIKTKTKLPLFAVCYVKKDCKYDDYTKGFEITVFFHEKKAKKLYTQKIFSLKHEIDDLNNLLQTAKTQETKYDILTGLLTKIESFSKLCTVALFLDVKNLPVISQSKSKVEQQLKNLQKSFDSIRLGAKFLSQSFLKKNIAIFPPKYKNYQQITEFGSVFKKHICSFINESKKPDYILSGEYEVLKDGIFLTYRLNDEFTGKTVSVNNIKLNKTAYKNLKYKPDYIDFEELSNQGLVKSNRFNVNLETKHGKDSLLYKKGETISLLVKSNKPAYFYITGHVNRKESKYSYLVELNSDSNRKRMFVYFINADDVNKWIQLGEFEVDAPFGFETLQLIASTKDLIDALPEFKYDRETELYKLFDDPKKSIIKTRALKPKKTNKDFGTEAVLSFTTQD